MMDEQQAKEAQERAGWAEVAKTANFTVGPGTVAGCLADGVGDPRVPHGGLGSIQGGNYNQASAWSVSESCESTRTLLARRIAKMRAVGEHERESGSRRLAEANALEALSQSLPLLLSHAADEGLRVLLGFGNR